MPKNKRQSFQGGNKRISRPRILILLAPPAAAPPSERYATRVLFVPRGGLHKRVVKQPSRQSRIQVFAPPPAQPSERYETRRLLLALTAVRRYHRRQVPARFTFTWPTGLEAAEAAWLKLQRVTQSRHHRWRQSYPRRLQILAPPPSAPPTERYATRLALRPLIGRPRRHVRKLSPSRRVQIFAPPIVQAPERYATRLLMRPLTVIPNRRFSRYHLRSSVAVTLQVLPSTGGNLSLLGVM